MQSNFNRSNTALSQIGKVLKVAISCFIVVFLFFLPVNALSILPPIFHPASSSYLIDFLDDLDVSNVDRGATFIAQERPIQPLLI